MNWNSVDQVLLKIPKPLLRMLTALLVWIGVTCTGESSVSIVIIGILWLKHSPNFANMHQSPVSALLENAGIFVVGLISLFLANRTAQLSAFISFKVTAESVTRQPEWRDFWLAFFRSDPNDRLSDWVINFEYSPDELKCRFEQEQKFPRVPAILALFLVDGTKPVVQVNGQKVCLATGASEFINSPWRGQISTDEFGNAVLQGRLGVRPVGWYMDAIQILLRLFIGAIGLVIILTSLSEGLAGLRNLIGVLILIFFWFFSEILNRSRRRMSRRHERQIESFFKGRLEAQAIYLTPRPEIFSKDWFKNFRKNR